jgi:hypothetical protein
VQHFLRVHAPDHGRLISLREELDELVARIEKNRLEQRQQASGGTWDGKRFRDARHELRELLLAVAGRGKTLLRLQPRTDRMLKVPHKKASNETLASYALELADWLKPYARLFVGVRFPRDFVTTIRAAAKELRAQTKRNERALRARAAATAAIARDLRQGHEIKTSLDRLLRKYTAEDSGLAIEWEDAKKVRKKMGRPRRKKPGRAEPRPESPEPPRA